MTFHSHYSGVNEEINILLRKCAPYTVEFRRTEFPLTLPPTGPALPYLNGGGQGTREMSTQNLEIYGKTLDTFLCQLCMQASAKYFEKCTL